MPNEIFFGSSSKALDATRRVFGDTVSCVCETSHLGQGLADYCSQQQVTLTSVDSLADLDMLSLEGAELGVSCGFGLIFPEHFIARFPSGIMNIHYGKLPDIRGRHPIAWAFLRNDKTFSVSFHMVDDQIDVGRLAHQFDLLREPGDTPESVQARIEARLEPELAEAVTNLRAGNLTPLTRGQYYPSLATRYKSVVAADHSSDFLYNLVITQKAHGGVKIDDHLTTECVFLQADLDCSNYKIITCQDGIKLGIR